MKKLRLLVLTQHKVHSAENSIYPILREMHRHPRCKAIDVASRSNPDNYLFFEKMAVKSLYASPVDSNFTYTAEGRFFERNLKKVGFEDYDAIMLRLPHPVPEEFWSFLATKFSGSLFINDPLGIKATGTKAYLLNYPGFCPPMQHCSLIAEVDEFRQKHPIVLKPVRGYGGHGILKIHGNTVSLAEGKTMTFEKWAKSLTEPLDYLAVKFLANVWEGDKRIVVCCGHVLGAALRKPKPGNWICNIAQGGSASKAEADDRELAIIETLTPVLEGFGIVFYGIDTLVGDDNKRVLSEINTLSIGGLPRIEQFSGKPVFRTAADLLWNYILDPDKKANLRS